MTHDPRTQNMSNADSICWAFFFFFFFLQKCFLNSCRLISQVIKYQQNFLWRGFFQNS